MQKKSRQQKIKNRVLCSYRALPAYGRAALFALAVSEILLFAGISIVGDFFYLFAWWPYIFLSDAIIAAVEGYSPILSRPRAFFYLLPWSTTIWLIFELFNLRLCNWHYLHLVSILPVRWIGYALSFATVLPGLFITSELLRVSEKFRHFACRSFRITGKLMVWCQLAGALMLILPILWPRYFFPLVWGGFVLVVDPVNLRLGAPSLLRDLSEGHPGRIVRLLASGLICGLLWEFWNFWATAKWIYTVPFVGNIKLFEMPVAGFLGFPPFALECFVMYTFITRMGGAEPLALHDLRMKSPRPAPLWSVFMGNALFWMYAFYLIDRMTVISFR